jgi:microcystin-dependent protein
MSDYYTITTPPGSIIAYIGSNDPKGWLICEGRSLSRTTYSNLFSVISTKYGAGDGSTTFNLPNFQGAFLRGSGNQSKNFNGTTITYQGTSVDNIGQSHATQVHNHTATSNDSGHSHYIAQDNLGGGAAERLTYGGGVGDHFENGTQTGYANITTTVNNSSSIGGIITNSTETRPFNFGVNWIIKY